MFLAVVVGIAANYWFGTGRLKKKEWIGISTVGNNKSFNEEENHHFKYIYDEIYTICYYSGFNSSLRDKNWADGCHFGISSND